MGLETATYISGLNASNPINATDVVGEGDDHLRLIKSTLLNTFPSITGAMSLTHTQLNNAAIKNEANTFTANQTVQGQLEVQGNLLRMNDSASAETNAMSIQVTGTETQIYTRYVKDLVLGYNLSERMRLTNTTVSIRYQTDDRLVTGPTGQVDIRANDNIDTSRRRLNFAHSDGTMRGFVGHETTIDFRMRNAINGGNIILEAANSVGTNNAMLNGSPDGAVNLYYTGTVRAGTTNNGGFGIYSTGNLDTNNRYLEYFHQNGTRRAFAGFPASTEFRIQNEVNSGAINLRGNSAAGAGRTVVGGSPDGGCFLYYAGQVAAFSEAEGLAIQDTSGDDPALLARQDDGSTQNGFIKWFGSGTMQIRNSVHGGDMQLECENGSGTIVEGIRINPSAGTWIYENDTGSNETAIITQGRTGDNSTCCNIRHRSGTFYDIGMNVVPKDASLDSGNDSIGVSNVGQMLYYNSATARTLNLVASFTGPDYSMWSLIVGPSAGTLTLDGGTGVVIRYWDGASWQDTAAGGTVTAGEGQYTIWHDSDTLFWVSGPQLS